jgi:hypothetical protein
VNQCGRRNEGIWHPQARQLTSQQTCSFGHAPINEYLLHSGEQSANAGFLIFVRTGKQLGPGDNRVSQSARSARQAL